MSKTIAEEFRGRRNGSTRSSLIRIVAAVAAALMVTVPAIAPVEGAQINQLRIARGEMGSTQHIEVGVNKSVVIDLPAAARDVIVSQPLVAGAIMRSTQRAIVQGVGVGETNIMFMDAEGRRIAVLEVSVTEDASALESTLARVIPGSRINVQQFGDRVILAGNANSSDDVQKALAIAAQFTQSPENVTSVIDVQGSQQVRLKVVVAEVSRELVKQLGIDFGVSYTQGGFSTSLITAPSLASSGIFGISNVSGGLTIEATLKALEGKGAVKFLAEPTLTALSGQKAEFLAGGEVPTLSSVDTDGSRTYTYRQFGVGLNFQPTVKSNGVIGLVIDSNVSEIASGGFDTGVGVIPAFTKRQVTTTVELPSGSTLAIAGLIQDEIRQQINQIPGLGDIPILGALFRSRDYVHQKTELVILVTPVVASIGRPDSLPTDRLVFADDMDTIFMGHMEKLYGVGDAKGGGGSYQGQAGFLLE